MNPTLHLVSDDYGRAAYVAGVRIGAGPPDSRPFEPDAKVVEEDTYLVLSAEVRIDPERSPVGKLVESMKQFDPIAPGSVMLRHGTPARLLAVVYDIDSEPNWQEAWIARAIDSTLELAAKHTFGSVEMPVLGARHGGMRPARFGHLLRRALERRGGGPRQIWVGCRSTDVEAILSALRGARRGD